MTTAQMITFRTDSPAEVERLRTQWETDTEGERTATKLTLFRIADSDRYVQLVEFPDRESADRNSALPATDRWAREMRSTVDDLDFTDLEIVDEVDVAAGG